jgi:hypothetical protein
LKYTHELFLEKACDVHGDRYDYSSVIWTPTTHSKTKVAITCKKHGVFNQTITAHINNPSNCPTCGGKARHTLDTFIARSHIVHGNKYDYSSVHWTPDTGAMTPIVITCKTHGPFTQLLNSHVNNGYGCQSCAGNATHSIKSFTKLANTIHHNKYDYSHINQTQKLTNSSEVTICCPDHGKFNQTVFGHIHSKVGCMICSKRTRYTQAAFARRVEQTHGNKYDYSLVDWDTSVASDSKIPIVCAIHGTFHQTVDSHVMRGSGCPACAGNARITRESFITRANLIHNSKYDYSSVVWTPTMNALSMVEIVCKTHGQFNQTINNHVNIGSGCQACSASKGEAAITAWLVINNIKFQREHKFPDCTNPITNHKLRFDFYLPDHNTCIEFHGGQHYKPVSFGSSKQVKDIEAIFVASQERDNIKQQYCLATGISLLVIPFSLISVIPELMTTHLLQLDSPVQNNTNTSNHATSTN